MNYEGQDLLASAAELVAASTLIGEPHGNLSRLPRVNPAPEIEDSVKAFFSSLSKERRALTESMIAAVANPVRAGTLHYSLGDLELKRCILVRHAQGGPAWTLMFFSESAWRLRLIAPDDLVRLIMAVLQEEVPLRSSPYRCCLNTSSALLFVGILHLLHAAHLQACLAHRESPLTFDASVLPDVMHEGATEDFRWPLHFFDKVLPHSVEVMPWLEDLKAALADLAAHGLIKAQGADHVLTMAGFVFAVSFRQHLTKVALRFTSEGETSAEAHEALLMVRSLHDLHLVDIGGKESALASLSLADARTLLAEMTKIGESETAPAAPMPAAQSVQTDGGHSCLVCGTRFALEEDVCPSCGTPAPARKTLPVHSPVPTQTLQPPPLPHKRFCKQCGQPLIKPGAKFCGHCGATVA